MDFGWHEGRDVLHALGYRGRRGAIFLADVYTFSGAELPDGWEPAIAYGLESLRLRLPRRVLRLFLRRHGVSDNAIDAAFEQVFGEP